MIRKTALVVLAMGLVACGAQAKSPEPTQTRVAPTGLRFARPPLVLYTKADRAYDFYVFVHMNRRFPQAVAGPVATLLIDHRNLDSGPVTLSKKPACYSAEIFTGDPPFPPAPLSAPRDGEKLSISVRRHGQTVAETTVHARRVSPDTFEGGSPQLARQLRRIGCPLPPVPKTG
jgi:hypothetical protein